MRGRPAPARVVWAESDGLYRYIGIIAGDIARRAYPGSYVMIWVPGFDETPMAIASASGDQIEITVSPPRMGDPSPLHSLSRGDLVGVRGPFGNPIPLRGSRVLLIGSSHGVSYLKFFSERHRDKIYGAILVDNGKGVPHLTRLEGLGIDVRITRNGDDLLRIVSSSIEAIDQAVVCVREDIGREVAKILSKSGVNSYICVERPIKCSLGLCGSCDLGIYRTCLEGVFMDINKILETEYGMWGRDKSGSRVLIGGSIDKGPGLSERRPDLDPSLSVEIAGLRLPNPLMNASGCGLSGGILYRFAMEGAGAIVTKSIGLEPRRGYRGPVLIEYIDRLYMNALGLPNPGVDGYAYEIMDAKKAGVPIIGSIFGRNPEEYLEVGKKIYGYGVSAIELNISCPHTEFEMVEDIPELVRDIVRSLKRVIDIPVFVKISANTDYVEVVRKAVEGGVDGVTAINTLRGFAYDHIFSRPLLGSPNGYGGISGPFLKPIVRRVIRDIRSEFNIPIIASGGIDCVEDIVDLLQLGARGFQICSAIAYKGFSIFREILRDLKRYMDEKGVKRLEDIIARGSG
jgi:dihydroorotate dehydrogenase (NAD+) catalytic subunit